MIDGQVEQVQFVAGPVRVRKDRCTITCQQLDGCSTVADQIRFGQRQAQIDVGG
jgi:hypothetical protein